MQEISAVCDHIMIISHGKLVLSGTPEELQQQANRGENIELEALGDKARVLEIVSSVAGVSATVEITGDRENSVALRIKSTEDLREALFFAFAKANLPLVKLVRNTKTLEDIFLEATSEKEEA
jgi:ABC-2 type transport system ATP-binding protein